MIGTSKYLACVSRYFFSTQRKNIDYVLMKVLFSIFTHGEGRF
ncbi:hypothetical protein ROSI111154_02610 [Rouxiella silvae]